MNIFLESSYWISLFPVIISLFLVKLFYRLFKNTWPDLYFSISDYTSLFISVSPWRYFAFTLLPTLLITSIVFSIFNINYQIHNLVFFGTLTGLLTSLSSNGVAFWRVLANDRSVHTFFNKYFQMLMHVVSIFTITISGSVAGFLAQQSFMRVFIPTIQGIIDNLWAALIASALTIFFYNIYTQKFIGSDEIINKSKNSLSARIIEHIISVCTKNNASKELVMAVCIVENIQRPPWVRRIEKIKSFIFKEGTYGIMQVQAKKYVDDFKSIELAVQKYFSNTASYPFDADILKSILTIYNSDSKFTDFVIVAYYNLTPKG